MTSPFPYHRFHRFHPQSLAFLDAYAVAAVGIFVMRILIFSYVISSVVPPPHRSLFRHSGLLFDVFFAATQTAPVCSLPGDLVEESLMAG